MATNAVMTRWYIYTDPQLWGDEVGVLRYDIRPYNKPLHVFHELLLKEAKKQLKKGGTGVFTNSDPFMLLLDNDLGMVRSEFLYYPSGNALGVMNETALLQNDQMVARNHLTPGQRIISVSSSKPTKADVESVRATLGCSKIIEESWRYTLDEIVMRPNESQPAVLLTVMRLVGNKGPDTSRVYFSTTIDPVMESRLNSQIFVTNCAADFAAARDEPLGSETDFTPLPVSGAGTSTRCVLVFPHRPSKGELMKALRDNGFSASHATPKLPN
jgi:hypothetical protein